MISRSYLVQTTICYKTGQTYLSRTSFFHTHARVQGKVVLLDGVVRRRNTLRHSVIITTQGKLHESKAIYVDLQTVD